MPTALQQEVSRARAFLSQLARICVSHHVQRSAQLDIEPYRFDVRRTNDYPSKCASTCAVHSSNRGHTEDAKLQSLNAFLSGGRTASMRRADGAQNTKLPALEAASTACIGPPQCNPLSRIPLPHFALEKRGQVENPDCPLGSIGTRMAGKFIVDQDRVSCVIGIEPKTA